MEGIYLFTKIIVMLKMRMYLQEQTLHYQPWATAALVQLGEEALLPPQALCTVSMAKLFTVSPSQSLWDIHRWTGTGGSGIVPLYD